MKCDLKCPPFPLRINYNLSSGLSYCCANCEATKKSYLSEETKRYWQDGLGFASKHGCRLPRELMPDECKEYDCKKYAFFLVYHWEDGAWNRFGVKCLPWVDRKFTKEFWEDYTQFWEKWIERDQ